MVTATAVRVEIELITGRLTATLRCPRSRDVRDRITPRHGVRWDGRAECWSVPARHLSAIERDLTAAGHEVVVRRVSR